ncbi:MAG: Ig-like domain-containing protein, partial [Bacteroidales bacterium]|nr:Ig-like domain-containing protein [Bacteroidales bacterium]
DNYINRWGGAFGGFMQGASGHGMFNQGSHATYWAQTDMIMAMGDGSYNFVNANSLSFAQSGFVRPLQSNAKSNGLTLRCIRDLQPGDTAVAGVILNQNSVELLIGDTLTLRTTVFPATAINQNVAWSSSNQAVAIVDSIGFVTAIAYGTAYIIVTTEEGNFSDTAVVTVVMQNRCNLNIPGWGDSLGMVSFYTDSIWIISNQVWSDAVTATACQKTTFYGGIGNVPNPNFSADCRSNPGFPGDLFSWCAVVRFADELCPYPWRVPIQQDFIDLDIAMGGTGNNRTDAQFVADNFITRWGGASGGLSISDDGSLSGQGSSGNYWSQTEITPGGAASRLQFITDGFSVGMINVQALVPFLKSSGNTLRCVRDVQPGDPIVSVTGVTLEPITADTLFGTGETLQLVATIFPENATDTRLVWSSSDSTVLTVSNSGVVTVISGGVATITATTQDGGHTATTSEIIVIVCPRTINDFIGEWIYTTPNFGSINSRWFGAGGRLVAVEDPNNLGAGIIMTMIPGSWDYYPEGLGWNQDVRITFDFDTNTWSWERQAIILPWETPIWGNFSGMDIAAGGGIIANSCNLPFSPVLSWNAWFVVTEGTTGFPNIAHTLTKIVPEDTVIPVTGINLNQHWDTLFIGDTLQLIATVFPYNATNQNVTWWSENDSVATVDNNGFITAVSPGWANILVVTEDGNFMDTTSVIVIARGNNNANLASLSVYPGTLLPAFSPFITNYIAIVPTDNDTFTFVTIYAISEDSNATVTGAGHTGFDEEKATTTIVVTAEDGTITKTYTLTVVRVKACLIDTITVIERDTLVFFDTLTLTVFDTVFMPCIDTTEGIFHTVTFNSHGGNNIPPQMVNWGGRITAPQDPVHSSHNQIFVGWFMTPARNCNLMWHFGTHIVTGDKTLNARFINLNQSFSTVSFNTQGGNHIPNRYVETNTQIMQPNDPIRMGYIFDGWFTEPAAITPWNFITNVATGNITLYAKWYDNSSILTDNVDMLETVVDALETIIDQLCELLAEFGVDCDDIFSRTNSNSRRISSMQSLLDRIASLHGNIEELLEIIEYLETVLDEHQATNITGEHVGSSLRVYPNPVTNLLHIVIPSEARNLFENNTVELFDMNGRRVFSKPSLRQAQGSVAEPVEATTFTIDMSPFPNGNYILRIGNRVTKIVKQ